MIENIYKGNSKSYTLTLTIKSTGLPKDITGATITFTVKDDMAAEDSAALIQVNGTITDGPNGEARVDLTPVNTNVTPGLYNYDFELLDVLGNITTILAGEVRILPHANQSEAV